MFDIGLPACRPGNTSVLSRSKFLRPVEHRNGAVAEGHTVFPPRLHPCGRHRPQRFSFVDLGPFGPQYLACAGRRQDKELEGEPSQLP